MSDQTYTYGAKYICIRQADDQPGAQYEPIAQCLSGHYDSPSWEGHAAFLVEAANSYASSQVELQRLRTLEAAVIAFMPLAQVAFLWQTKGARPGEVERYRDAYHCVKSALSGSKE